MDHRRIDVLISESVDIRANQKILRGRINGADFRDRKEKGEDGKGRVKVRTMEEKGKAGSVACYR